MPRKRRRATGPRLRHLLPLCYTPRVSQPPMPTSHQRDYHARTCHVQGRAGAGPHRRIQPHKKPVDVEAEREKASRSACRYQNTKETLHANCFKAGTRHSACPHRLRLVPSSRWARRRGRRQSHVDKVSQHARIRRTQLLPRVRLDRKVDLFRPGLRVGLGGAGAGFGLGLGQPWTGHRAACSSAAAACGFWPG